MNATAEGRSPKSAGFLTPGTWVPLGAVIGFAAVIFIAGQWIDVRVGKIDQRLQTGERQVAIIGERLSAVADDVRDLKIKADSVSTLREQIARLQVEIERGRVERDALRLEVERLKNERGK